MNPSQNRPLFKAFSKPTHPSVKAPRTSKSAGGRLAGWGATLLLFILAAGNLRAQDVGVWGWKANEWKSLLREKCNIDATTLPQAAKANSIPVDEFANYKLVILSQANPPSLEPAQHEVIRRYLENGGFLLINNITINAMAAPEDKTDLSQAEHWLGATKIQYIPAKIYGEKLEPNHPALKHLENNHYAWLVSERGLSGLTTARNLIGQHDSSIVLSNQVGKGGVIYVFPEVTSQAKEEESTQDAETLLKMIQTFVDAIMTGSPSIEEVFGSSH